MKLKKLLGTLNMTTLAKNLFFFALILQNYSTSYAASDFDEEAENKKLLKVLRYHTLGRNLLDAVFGGDLEGALKAIGNGANRNWTDEDGETALHRAMYSDETELFNFALGLGIDLNAKKDNGDTALHLAVIWKKPDYIKLLIQKGANTNLKNKTNKTPEQLLEYFPNKTCEEVFQNSRNKKLEKKSPAT